MSNTIDCSRMSHYSCFAPSEDPASEPRARTELAEPARDLTSGGEPSYDCVNDCVSSLGIPGLVGGALSSLGCLLVPPACAVLIGATAGSMLGACTGACEELESKPESK